MRTMSFRRWRVQYSKWLSQRWTAGKSRRRPMGSRRERLLVCCHYVFESATGVLGEGSYFKKRPGEEGGIAPSLDPTTSTAALQ
jgi:hypothetical protein